MRDIEAILNSFKNNENIMNYSKDFDVIKGILEYCNENIKKFDKIQFRGGNEKSILEITTRIQNYFKEKQYINDDLEPHKDKLIELRRITFFLVLNTDSTYKYNLHDDLNICHCLDILPQISKCLLTNIIWSLKLDIFFYEIIQYTPSWFSFQYCEPSVQSLKHISEPYEVLEKVENLLKSMFGNLIRSDLRVSDNVTQSIILNKFYDTIMDLLRQFYTPDAEKFQQFTKKEFFKYSGYAMRHLLDMILYCFDCYEIELIRGIDKNFEIYEIATVASPFEERKTSKQVREMELKIISSLLNSLQYNVMLITIDVFMYWMEIDLSDELTLQGCVGEKAYCVLERMSKNKEFSHDVDQQLKSIAIRPKTFQELIKEATIGEILCKLDELTEYNEKIEWFNELLKREIAFGNEECLNSILTNTKLMTTTNFLQIIDYIKLEQDHLNTENATLMEIDDEEDIEIQLLIKIMLKSLHNFNTEQLIEICLYAIKRFGQNYNRFEQPQLDQRCTEFFNKYIENFDLNKFLRYSFENPKKVWTKFFDESCTSVEQVRNYCQTINKTLKLSNNYFEPLFNLSFSSRKCEEKFFPNLIADVYFQLYKDKKMNFFRQFINKNCTEILNSQNWIDLLPILKALLIMSNQHSMNVGLVFGEVTAPVLLMTAQIMDQCRWDLISYTDLRDEIVRNCIEFIQNVSKKFLPIASEKDKLWINKVTKTYRPYTQYYFQKFTLPLGVSPKKFDKFLHPEKFENEIDIEKFLISTFVRCTTKETEWLAKSDKLLSHISDVILMLNGIVSEIGGTDVLQLYRHCMINYGKILRKFLIPNLINDSTNQIRDLSFKLLNIIDAAPIPIYDEIFMSFHSILLEIIQKLNSPIEEELIRDLKTFLTTMKDCKGKEIFNETFQAIAIENLS